ncbi:MAG: NAD(P)-binding domain-containing protein [Chloroflexi bacterium]|nr:NAD(P)-binding domain-containing protein [Chloroflexota bacterium]
MSADDNDLERLLVVFATFRELPTERREALAADPSALAAGLDEWLLLHTCHRIELIGLSGRAPLPPPRSGLRLVRGLKAVERVLLVSAGLDSAVIAEEQILGQVRDAYETALARGQTGPITNELLRRAIRFGKRVRAEAQPGSDRSLADRAAAWAIARLARNDDQPREHALVVGSGQMGRLLATRLAEAGMLVTVASRSGERAARVAEALPRVGRQDRAHQSVLTDQALKQAAQYDAIAIAVRSSTWLLDAAHFGTERPVVVDLSSPGAVSTQLAARLGDRLLDLDRLGQTGGGSSLDRAAERRVRADLDATRDRLVAWLRDHHNGDGIALLRQQTEEIRRRHLDRLRRRAQLSQEQLAAVEAMTAAMLAELLHVPTLQLRRSDDATARVRELFGFGA